MNYRCKLESNWRTFVGVHESDDLIEIEMIDTVENETILRGERERESSRSKRYVWARDKFYAAQKHHTVGFFIVARMLRAVWRSSIAHTHRLSMQVSVTRKGQR